MDNKSKKAYAILILVFIIALLFATCGENYKERQENERQMKRMVYEQQILTDYTFSAESFAYVEGKNVSAEIMDITPFAESTSIGLKVKLTAYPKEGAGGNGTDLQGITLAVKCYDNDGVLVGSDNNLSNRSAKFGDIVTIETCGVDLKEPGEYTLKFEVWN